MKKIFFAIIIVFGFTYSSFSQIVVPKGWESKDSIRFTFFSMRSAVFGVPFQFDTSRFFLQMDSLNVNWDGEFNKFPYDLTLRSHIYGVSAYGIDTGGEFFPRPTALGVDFKQLPYSALPFQLPERFYDGLKWQYNDYNIGGHPTGITFSNNTYDANDISPYTEFPQSNTIVQAPLITRRNKSGLGSDFDTLLYGNEGRVILGMSDIRDVNKQLKESVNAYFKNIGSGRYQRDTVYGGHKDTAKAFSVTVTFNIEDGIDTAFSAGRDSLDLPLVRVQVLFKRGKDPLDPLDNGQSVLPFVPFKTNAHPSNPGWWILADKIITKKYYNDSLSFSWRVPDTLGNGAPAHSWNFKQLHILLNNLPSDLQRVVDVRILHDASEFLNYDLAEGQHDVIDTQYIHPDSLVDDSTDINIKKAPIFEVRILSTYRSIVRVRSLEIEDTTVDKFLYRKPDGLTSHSCEPDGRKGGFDSIVATVFRDQPALPNGMMLELHYNDTWDAFKRYSYPMISYLDYMGSAYNIYSHIHEQDAGNYSLHFRRDRRSYDGSVPSMFENEGQPPPHDASAMPGDYVYYGHTRSISDTIPWPSSSDRLVGMQFTRKTSRSDSMASYHAFDAIFNGAEFLSTDIRKSTYVAQHHPLNKRYTIEANIPVWGEIFDKGVRDTVYYPDSVDYHNHFPFPELTSAYTFGFIANGVTALNIAQTIDKAGNNFAAPGLLSVNHHDHQIHWYDSVYFHHDFNFGHGTYFWTDQNNDVDSVLPNYYLGYSNNWRVVKRCLERINQIYDTNAYNKFPLKRFSWQDAYSTHKALTIDTTIHPINTDSLTRKNSFLKCFCTTKINPRKRGKRNEYIDSLKMGGLVADPGEKTFAEVGLFRDSSNGVNGYAALVVNTRMYPSLRDADDSGYYNKGFEAAVDSIQRCRSIYGDIDVRKFWFTIDTSKMDPSFRTNYYVVRDLWHQDSVWLVKNDSNFAIYIKPGEAKFLYFEKGVAIRMAKSAATEEDEYGFNNGRRVAEIMDSSRTIGTYVRNGRLYVSYPRKGYTIEGYNERSAGDNIATGHEVLLDSTGINSRPSISAGMNDTAIAIVYWNSADSGRIKVAYQKHPDSAWMFTRYMDHPFQDTTSDHSEVLPVITPYANGVGYATFINGSDSIWWIAASYQGITGNAADPQGIAALLLKIYRDSIRFKNDNPMQYFYKNLVFNPSRDASSFPTITSRSIPDFRYPVRLAWQNYGKILYNRFKDVTGTITADFATPFIASDGLPSLCYNRHPSIAMHLQRYADAGIGIGTGLGCGCCCTPPSPGTPIIQAIKGDLNDKIYDELTWESKLFNNGTWVTNNNYWPVLRQRIEYLATVKPGTWSSFRVFKPYLDSAYYHYPIVSAASRRDTNENIKTILNKKPVYYENIRLAWQDKPDGYLDFAHHVNNWKRSILQEMGTHPSLPQSTFNLYYMTDSSMVPASVSFVGLQTEDGKNQVRVTNGWFPKVATVLNTHIYPTLIFNLRQDMAYFDCLAPKRKDNYGGISIVRGGGAYRTVDWLSYDPEPSSPIPMIGMPSDTISAETESTIAFYSDTMSFLPGDSIIIARKTDTINLGGIRSALIDSSDYLIIRTTLRRAIDTSIIATLDSSVITKAVAYYPGNGMDAKFARYQYPGGASPDSGFILVQVIRGNVNDSLHWAASELFIDTTLSMASFKRSFSPITKAVISPSVLKVDVVPNPFTQSTMVKINSAEGLITHVEVFDVLGRKISDLYNESFPSSPVEIRFEAAILSAGAYYVRIQSGSEVVTRKIQLVK